jgi:uncharacterized protein YjiS (DUF1127 family)
VKSFFKRVLEVIAQAQQERARRAAFESLDAHTLRDIGLEHEAERARRRSARERLQFSVYY